MSITTLEAQQASVRLYTDVVAICILIYDHISTLPEEIAFIWYRPKTLSAMLFFVNRYVALLSNISHMLGDFLPISNQSCLKYLVAREVLIHFQQTLIFIILFLRTYALYGCSRRLLKWMVIISLPLAAVVWVGTFGHDSKTVTDGSCYEIYTTATSIRQCILSHIWMSIDGATKSFNRRSWDSMACKTRGFLRFFQISRKDILDVIFHDGVMYFAGMTLVNLPNILTYFCGSDITRSSLSAITSCMSVALVSRVMLNLHESMDTGIFSTSATTNIDILTTRVSVLQSEVSSEHW
ncbi:hypothetical protein BDR04DRAFT_1103215 [Suillus decipiens]|nr:hypothetical protein BDR04DRAFT_1103215 [Suillus decipiens]